MLSNINNDAFLCGYLQLWTIVKLFQLSFDFSLPTDAPPFIKNKKNESAQRKVESRSVMFARSLSENKSLVWYL